MTALVDLDCTIFMVAVCLTGSVEVEVTRAESGSVDHRKSFTGLQVVESLLLAALEHNEVARDPFQHGRQVIRNHEGA